jgi:hypothetical protein
VAALSGGPRRALPAQSLGSLHVIRRLGEKQLRVIRARQIGTEARDWLQRCKSRCWQAAVVLAARTRDPRWARLWVMTEMPSRCDAAMPWLGQFRDDRAHGAGGSLVPSGTDAAAVSAQVTCGGTGRRQGAATAIIPADHSSEAVT